MKPLHTFKSGTKSGPSGVSTLTRVVCTFQVPRKSSGNVRSEGPPPMDDQALSTASGKRLACADTAVAKKQSGTEMVNAKQNKTGCDANQEAKACTRWHQKTIQCVYGKIVPLLQEHGAALMQ